MNGKRIQRAVAVAMAFVGCLVLVPRPVLADTEEEPVQDNGEAIASPEVTAAGAVLWDPLDDRVLFGVEPEAPRPMASTTKVMTILLALEADTLYDTVTVSAEAAARGEATLNLTAGQEVPMDSLIGGLTLVSGNDAALALAEHVAGSEPAFVEQMNERAAELGLDATQFINASGLTNDASHHASPLDLARLAQVAMDHDVFANYAAMQTATLPGVGTVTNRNELLGQYEPATGIKTGYTAAAGNSLIASATQDGRTLYAVVLNSADRAADAQELLEYGFAAFERAEPVTAEGVATTYRTAAGEVQVVLAEPLGKTVGVDQQVTWRTLLTPLASLHNAVSASDELGSMELLVEDEVEATAPLVASEDLESPNDASDTTAVGHAIQDALRGMARTAVIDRQHHPGDAETD